MKIKPQGKPHQPRIIDEAVASNIDLVPHPWQETSGVLFQDVKTKADHTVCVVWTSTGPGPPHLGQLPW